MSKYSYTRQKDKSFAKRPEIKQLSLKKALPVILTTIGAVFVYYLTGIVFKFMYIVHIYGVIMGVCFLLFGIFNRGFSRKPPSKDIMPSDWTEQEKEGAVEEWHHRRSIANIFLTVAVAIMLTFLFDLIYLYFVGLYSETSV